MTPSLTVNDRCRHYRHSPSHPFRGDGVTVTVAVTVGGGRSATEERATRCQDLVAGAEPATSPASAAAAPAVADEGFCLPSHCGAGFVEMIELLRHHERCGAPSKPRGGQKRRQQGRVRPGAAGGATGRNLS